MRLLLACARASRWHDGTVHVRAKIPIGPAITIDTPVPIGPLNGGRPARGPRSASETRHGRDRPADYLQVRHRHGVDVQPDSRHRHGSEGVNETGFIPTSDLPINAPLFWRATPSTRPTRVERAEHVARFHDIARDRPEQGHPVISGGAVRSTGAAWRRTRPFQSVEQDGNPAADGIMCIAFTRATTGRARRSLARRGPGVRESVVLREHRRQWYGGPGEYLRVAAASARRDKVPSRHRADGGWNTVMASWAPRSESWWATHDPAAGANWPGMRTIDERSDIVVQRGAIRVSDQGRGAVRDENVSSAMRTFLLLCPARLC